MKNRLPRSSKLSRLFLLIGSLSALLVCGSACAGTGEIKTDTESEPSSVLLFGDSNTFGYMPIPFESHIYRYPSQQRWPVITANTLGSHYSVITDGLMGRTINKPHAFYGDSKRGTPYKYIHRKHPIGYHGHYAGNK